MAKKSKKEIIETDVSKEVTEEVTEELEKEPTLEELLEQKETEIKELKNELLKQHADLDNIRKRLEKERTLERKYAAMNVCKGLITPLDHFDLALNHETTDEAVKNFMQGFKMIKEELSKALETEGVTEIDALDEEYNPQFHQAIMTEKVEG